ncbi:L-lactate dehydrogenase complex protein LldG [Hamadaea flava]|uniref:Lactate utilization protein C n=1 Tax=Hamadaea flava TaxID=1742688 RepID=A0ABV8LV01_9ACTN|nr:LUD domain-containing protein [Hamadaea flava]MCP2321884.1 L-lactate dehydrogenase complex protein LldG [Hamadaea flava]
MSARDDILARIHAANTGIAAPPVPRDYRRTGTHAPGDAELLELFTDRLVDYKATVVPCTPATLAATLADICRDWTVVVPAGSASSVPGAVVDDGLSYAQLDALDAVLTGCAAACAETGTIALDAGPDQGRRAVTLIPDRHICVVRADQVVHTVPELLARLDPTRPLTFISGPSATSDIELHRVEGVHGPRTLIVVLVTLSGGLRRRA